MQRASLILACFFIGACSFAQQYPFVHYTPKDGLVNSRVRKAYQDSKGRMYFLTYGGLSVYDGARFRNYTTQNGLSNNIVNDILEIGDDSMLVATNSSNLSLLVNGIAEPFKTENNFCPLVNQFYRHDDGRIYLSSDFGLFRLEKNRIDELNISMLKPFSQNQSNFGNIAGAGNYLVITTNEMNFNQGVFLYDIKNNLICDMLPGKPAILLGKDNKNRIWINSNNQLLIMDNKALQSGKLSVIPPDRGFRQVENYSTINVAFGKNILWLVFRNETYRNSELRRISEDGNMLRINLPDQATTTYIMNLFVDRENNIWLCNDGEGVFKIIRSPLQVIENPLGPSGEGQISNAYYCNDTVWYNTLTTKLFRKSPADFKEFSTNLDQSPLIFYNKGKNILARNAANIYFGNISEQTSKISFQKIISLPDSNLFGRKLIVAPNGMIIAGLKSGLGIWINNKLIQQVPVPQYEYIEDFFTDKNNRFWMIKRSTGIEVFTMHPENSSTYLQPVFQIPGDQLAGSVRSCVMDKNGLIWIGTRDQGLIAYALKHNKLEKLFHFHTGNGLTDNFVTSLSCDSINNIIAGTQTGLDRILYGQNNDYRVENLSRNNNLFAYIKETWADAGNAYALTISGVILQVVPATAEKPGQSPQLLLEEVKVNTKTISPQKADFNYRENNISLFVAAPSFIDEKQISYSYLLEGSGNNRWSDTTAANAVINLTNLSAGDYKLRVKAFFPSNIYSPSELSYSFSIMPPWWQTWWFRGIAGLLIIGLLISGFRFYYRRKLEKQMAVLEKQQAIEKERTRIATDMHDDLGAGLSRIKFLSQALSNKEVTDVSVKTGLEKITTYSDEMTEKMGEIVWALNEKNDTLADLVAYTRTYSLEYLANHNISCKMNTPMHLPGTFIAGEIRRNIFLAVKECLHNIVKHADATQVYFSIQLNGAIEIVIHDNGKGIDWNNLRAFSNGIQNIKKRMNEINGKAEFINEQGTKVRLRIPLHL